MSVHTAKPPQPSRRGEPVWELARFYPAQGTWSEEDYLELALDTNRLVELSDGYLEVLPVPTDKHQAILAFIFKVLDAFVEARALGKVRLAGVPLHLRPQKYREPDILFLLAANDRKRKNEGWEAADLVMEIVSEKGRTRDLITKRREYAQAGIAEYWIVDAKKNQITVLKLDGQKYVEHGIFKKGSTATSVLLDGFSVNVTKALSAE
ncbi:MAG TPA: Uma2 family endonuclease [Planctomycetota bacterium]|nr:Uma2 family endonuclease [Planctomycetota bacterium]